MAPLGNTLGNSKIEEKIMPDPINLIKKTMLTGIGLALKTWDEVEDLAKELEKRGKMTETEGRKFLDELQARYEEAQGKLEQRVEESVKRLLKKADIVTSEELKGIKREIRELKKIVSDLSAEED
jgi:polyhydroxyalkanoate synthesis regulator phasin